MAGSDSQAILSNDSVSDKPYLQFDRVSYNFGEVIASEQEDGLISIDFTFVNSSDSPIDITKAIVSCGCVSVRFPQVSIHKGEKGVITVFLNTKLVSGSFRKSVYVESNAENDVEILHISGTIQNDKKNT